MFRQFFKAIVVARQVSATTTAMNYMSDSQLNDLGYDRSNYVGAVKSRLIAELDAHINAIDNTAPVNANLVGAV
jgi:hypothetical protein